MNWTERWQADPELSLLLMRLLWKHPNVLGIYSLHLSHNTIYMYMYNNTAVCNYLWDIRFWLGEKWDCYTLEMEAPNIGNRLPDYTVSQPRWPQYTIISWSHTPGISNCRRLVAPVPPSILPGDKHFCIVSSTFYLCLQTGCEPYC